MIIFNTTYSVPTEDAKLFVIWMKEYLCPKAEEQDMIRDCRIMRVLNHHEQGFECICVQCKVDDTATLHKWLLSTGKEISRELQKTFEKRVLEFSTLMEEIQ